MYTAHRMPLGKRPRPLLLIICDGFGVAPPGKGNAISEAKTPNLDSYIRSYPSMTLVASGQEVGLSWGEMGNSEVGHLNIGAGLVYYQTFPRINKTIEDGTFFQNPALVGAVQSVKSKGTLHLIGLVSNGNVHAAQEHLYALLELAKREKAGSVAIHAILDGRDAGRDKGLFFVTELLSKIKEIGVKQAFIATLTGRYYALDRDNRWERVEKAYRAIAEGASDAAAPDPLAAIQQSYAKEIFDEEFMPTVITRAGRPAAAVADGDAIIFYNFRPDRARELTAAFVLPSFDKFPRPKRIACTFVTFTEYEKNLPVTVAYPPLAVKNPLAKVIADAGLKQLHIAETEKYAHVTFFLNGTLEEPFSNEERILIPSPHVSSYDQKPEMAAREIASRAVKEIKKGSADVIIINFANADMVGHTGNMKATVAGIEAIDSAIGDVVKAALDKEGAAIITADHGNAEEVINLRTGEIDKEHSTNPVPFIVIGKQWEGQNAGLPEGVGGDLSLVPPVGFLADVAPTVLKIIGLKPPSEMTGRPLI